MLSNRVLKDGVWVSMPAGYPKMETQGGSAIFIFRFPKFNVNATYDPIVGMSSTIAESEPESQSEPGPVTETSSPSPGPVTEKGSPSQEPVTENSSPSPDSDSLILFPMGNLSSSHHDSSIYFLFQIVTFMSLILLAV